MLLQYDRRTLVLSQYWHIYNYFKSVLYHQEISILKTTVEELNKEIADKNMTEEQMKTKIVAHEELVDKLSQVITIYHCINEDISNF